MNAPRWLTALLVLLSITAAADAQFVPDSYGGLSYSRVRGRSSLSIGFGFGYGYGRGYYCPPYYPGYDLYGYRSTRITVVTVAPQPIYVLPPPGSLFDQLPPDVLPRGRQLDQVPPPEPPVIKIGPKQKDEPKKDEPKKDEPKKDEDKQKPPPRKPPEPEPADEFSRLMRDGRELFAQQQYGRAAARFRQASGLDAAAPLPYFLLAQSLLEQGKYDGARDAILAGLKRKPDWPTAKFRPQELYGPNPDYAELLMALERAQSRLPNDPVLLLLRGYALWFDGQKESSAVLLRKAAKGPDRAAVERFLATLPDEVL